MIGVAWGTTLANVVKHIDRRPVKGTTIVQLNGGGTPAIPVRPMSAAPSRA